MYIYIYVCICICIYSCVCVCFPTMIVWHFFLKVDALQTGTTKKWDEWGKKNKHISLCHHLTDENICGKKNEVAAACEL